MQLYFMNMFFFSLNDTIDKKVIQKTINNILFEVLL